MFSDLPRAPLDVALLGAGRVGTAVALLLQRSGHRIVGVASPSAASATSAAERLGSPVFELGDLPDADLYLIGAPAAVLTGLARQLAATGLVRDRVLCHFAGSVGIAPLEECQSAGASVCALHPVQACPDVDSAVRNLPGSAWGVTCSNDLRHWARSLIERDLAGTPVEVAEKDRPLWHAAAVVTSNGIAALLASGESILREIGVESPEGVLGPLAAGTVANARTGGGGGETLTGPLVRGEIDTVAEQLRHLDGLGPDHADRYVLASKLILSVARRGDRSFEDIEALLQR